MIFENGEDLIAKAAFDTLRPYFDAIEAAKTDRDFITSTARVLMATNLLLAAVDAYWEKQIADQSRLHVVRSVMGMMAANQDTLLDPAKVREMVEGWLKETPA